jgi:hypothetical protein
LHFATLIFISPEPTNTTNQNMPCGICKQTGHNARTCQSELALPDLFDVETVDRFNLDTENVFLEEMWRDAEEPFEYPEPETEKKECMVCYEEVLNESVTIKCGHTYCVTCFVKHMRTQGTCAYCREEVCEPPTKKSLAPDSRASIIDQWLDNSRDLNDLIRGEFVRQMRENMANNRNIIRTDTVDRVENWCVEAAMNTNMTFSLWMAGVRASEYTSYWYESDA